MSLKLLLLLLTSVNLSMQEQVQEQQQEQQQSSNNATKIRILALFSTTKNELGLDHRLGRQVIRLASQKAIQLHPDLQDNERLEVLIDNDDNECNSLNELPNRVAEQYYSHDISDECKLNNMKKYCSQQDIDSTQLDRYFSSQNSIMRSKRRIVDVSKGNDMNIGSVDVILGPSCQYLVDLIARMAAYWKLPIYSVASISAQFSDKDIYPTLTRLSPSIDQLSLFIMRTMQKFNWFHMAILVDHEQIENSLMLENLEQTIARQSHLHPIKRKVFATNSQKMRLKQGIDRTKVGGSISKCTQEARDILMKSRQVARVILLLINGQQTVRQLLLCAYELGFRQAGFTFLALDLGLKSVDLQQRRESRAGTIDDKLIGQQQQQQSSGFDWYLSDDEENNSLAKQMFESLMVYSIGLPIGDEYNLFVEQTLDLAHQQYPQIRFDRSAVNSLAVALHDSFLLAIEAHLKYSPNSPTTTTAVTAGNVPRATRISFSNRSGIDDADWIENRQRTPLMWNEHIESASRIGFISPSLHINSNGDQELDYVLSDLDPELGVMRPVASFSGKDTRRQFELISDTYIHWPKRFNTMTGELSAANSDQVPPDEPECGFDDQAEHCIDRQNLYAALTILVSLIAALSLGSMFSLWKYRKIKYQMKLDDYWWKINWEDLQFIQMTESLASNAQGVARALKSSGASIVSAGSDGGHSFISVMRTKPGQVQATIAGKTDASSESVISKAVNRQQRRQAVPLIITSTQENTHQETGYSQTDDARSVMTTKTSSPNSFVGSVLIRSEYSSVVRASNLAMFKDELVIVKQLNADKIEVSHELLVELKSIRELVNDNLARFIGLCLDTQRLAIVYEFCSRGSLQDLILNKDIAMDLTLKYSIIGDIVNGLTFIHTTLLDYHGRLKSTNLCLDGRFTVKITDFGLQNLYSQLDPIQNQSQDEEDSGLDEDEDGHQQADQISLSVSQAAYNMESVSVVGSARNDRSPGGWGAAGSQSGYNRMKLRNRGAARFFWTAPEHLREKNAHFVGSKKGDIYSLAIILLEIFTRREPYYYGTNAQPHWPNINRDRRLFMQQQHQHLHQHQAPDQQSLAVSRLFSSKSSGRKSRNSARVQLGAPELSTGPGRRMSQLGGRRGYIKRNSVSPAAIEPPGTASDAISIISGNSSANQQSAALEEDRKSTTNMEELEEADNIEELPASIHHSQVFGDATNQGKSNKRLDAEEILDQLRMGIKPEPVRPYIPNYIGHQIGSKLIELTRSCWNESAQSRPPLQQIRTQLRKISRGLASKNYLDNLLDRLQHYAADLERIVDSKSADIMGEKLRTEELLYQLVPKFVAERLKRSEPIIPQVFDGVTIFFSDIVGFEKYASVMSPTELVDLLNSVYSSFDSIISSFDVTKIETIIDQFLVAAGITFQEHNSSTAPVAASKAIEDSKETPVAADEVARKSGPRKGKLKRIGLLGSLGKGNSSGSQDLNGSRNDSLEQQQQQPQQQLLSDSNHYRRSSAEQIGRMALCIRDLVKSFHFRQNLTNQHQQQSSPLMGSHFNIRIGIHSGKVCAGIVGVKRPKFCLIGDTVNVASRMHTNSKANRIQISDDTRQLLEQVPGFSIEPRGKIEVKGKGLMETFWLESSY